MAAYPDMEIGITVVFLRLIVFHSTKFNLLLNAQVSFAFRVWNIMQPDVRDLQHHCERHHFSSGLASTVRTLIPPLYLQMKEARYVSHIARRLKRSEGKWIKYLHFFQGYQGRSWRL